MESHSGSKRVTFSLLRARLLHILRYRINNGEFTERGLARLTGISQPQVHNILKGARNLTPEAADLLLSRLEMTVLDLLTPADVAPLNSGVSSGGPYVIVAAEPSLPAGPALVSDSSLASSSLLNLESALALKKPPSRDIPALLSRKERLG